MADQRVRIEMEDLANPGSWVTVAVAPGMEEAIKVEEALLPLGISVSLTCGCGSYSAGECELCNDPETEPSPTMDALCESKVEAMKMAAHAATLAGDFDKQGKVIRDLDRLWSDHKAAQAFYTELEKLR